MNEDNELALIKELRGVRICLVVLVVVAVLTFLVELLNIRL